ncbi:pantoate--beta-alanine ligase [Oligoflexia bacterium]|nr:pantoate--beta-alanine ligase [Oligoflexia bacterium]
MQKKIEVFKTIETLRAGVKQVKSKGLRLGLVPTMGFLHEGHLSLVELAQQHSDQVFVSIFVNPAQFNDRGDLERYPVDIPKDIERLAERGVAAVFNPTPEMIYGPHFQSWVTVSELADTWEGADRPGHFKGVATVVSILFNLLQPDVAVFGEKDFQQLRIIERMVVDLKFGIDIVRGPLIREQDGLAMSSRNTFLTSEQRATALAINQGLYRAREAFDKGEREAKRLVALALEQLEGEAHVKIHYMSVVDEEMLQEVDQAQDSGTRILAAVEVGGIRLIDNISLVA